MLNNVKKSAKDGDIALTGQYLGVIEEFLPDKKTTYVREGEIFSTKTGLISINKDKREIEIKTKMEKDRKTVNLGDIVIGTIVFLRKFSVGVSFIAINNKVHFNSSYMGNIHVSAISNRYVEKISDAFQIYTLKKGFYSVLSGDSKPILITGDKELADATRKEGLRVWNCMKEVAP